MMEINVKYLMIICLLIWGSCSSSSRTCPIVKLSSGDITIYLEPYPTASILSYESERGIISPNQCEQRKKELSDKIHIKIKVKNTSQFTVEEKNYLKNKMKNGISIYQGKTTLSQELFIDESGFSSGNLAQFLVAYKKDLENNDQNIEVWISSEELGFQGAKVKFQVNCFN